MKPSLTTFRGYIAVIKPEGHLVHGELDDLRNVMAVAFAEYRRIIIDLGDVDKIDAGGLGELVSYRNRAREVGAFLALTKLTKRLRDLLVITKLITVFPIIDNDVLEEDDPNERPHPMGPGWWLHLQHFYGVKLSMSI